MSVGTGAAIGRVDGPIRVAVVGYGFSGRLIHLPLIDAVVGFEVVAVVARSAETRATIRHDHPKMAAVATMSEALDLTPAVDLIVVATPDVTHVALATQALEAGKHVLVDKPLAPSYAEARQLHRLAADRQRTLTTFHNKRWDTDLQFVQSFVQNEALGAVYRFDSWIVSWNPQVGPGWRDAGSTAPLSGRLADLGSHLVDQAIHLFGRVGSVYGEMDTRRPQARVNDDAFIALTHLSGIRSHIHLGSTTGHATPTFQLQGEKGYLVTAGRDAQFERLARGHGPNHAEWRQPQPWSFETDVGVPASARTAGDWRDFYVALHSFLRHASPPPVEPADVEQGLEILEQVARSSELRARPR